MIQLTWPRDQFTGPGGGLYTGPGGGLYAGIDGGAYAGPDGRLYTGSSINPYRSNIPPWPIFIKYVKSNGMNELAHLISSYIPNL
ncbi:hypothetical protein [Leptospira broomii]|uniref:hypothetical protein n=1 Tax=Leptospira broomii TaxID=301541 RepID=UPI000288BCAB|nr:hypothetical protein [Leptospira broomii]